jgi:glycosyltransferase involved in cell wall biosynthesis
MLVVSPVKDEAKYLERTIRSMVAQEVRPRRWIIVDDGSTDRTGELADEAAREHRWISVLHRQGTAERRVGPGVVEAFYAGLALANIDEYDYVCKLDGDLEFQPGYFAELFRRFAKNPKLGTASGKAHIPVGDHFVLERSGDDFSHGVAKLYRRQCFEEIGGIVREVMWDGIDCHRCRMLGWEAVSYDDPDLAILHLRQMGSSFKSVYHGRMRWGRGQYFMGTHPVYLFGIMIYRMFERPWILGGLCILLGYILAWYKRIRRYEEPGFRRFLHHWQMKELSRRFLGRRGTAERSKSVTAIPPLSAFERSPVAIGHGDQ